MVARMVARRVDHTAIDERLIVVVAHADDLSRARARTLELRVSRRVVTALAVAGAEILTALVAVISRRVRGRLLPRALRQRARARARARLRLRSGRRRRG